MTDPDVDEVRQAEKLLSDLRQALLRLHKTLLDWERGGYERIHGRQSSHDLLEAVLNDPQFAWPRCPSSSSASMRSLVRRRRRCGTTWKPSFRM